VAIVTKPKLGLKQFLQRLGRRAGPRRARRGARQRAPPGARPPRPPPGTAKHTADAILPPAARAMTQTTERVVAIGTSTGGTQALEEVLTALPRVCPAS
jgi:two-component system chemotaxis response regulator CheB